MTTTTDQVVDEFREALIAVLPADDLIQIPLDALDSETQLLSLPIDSVILMSVMNELEEHFAVFITEEAAFEFATIGDVAQYIQTRQADKERRLSAP